MEYNFVFLTCSSPNYYSAIDFVWEMVQVKTYSVASSSQMYFWQFFKHENIKKIFQ